MWLVQENIAENLKVLRNYFTKIYVNLTIYSEQSLQTTLLLSLQAGGCVVVGSVGFGGPEIIGREDVVATAFVVVGFVVVGFAVVGIVVVGSVGV